MKTLINPRELRAVVLLLLALPLLSGCLLNRLFAVKEQFCDFERHFVLKTGADTHLTMLHPVLLATDMVWLAGAAPTEKVSTAKNLRMNYVMERDPPTTDSPQLLSSQMKFVRSRGKLRLQEGYLDRNLTSLLTPGLVRQAAAAACKVKPSISGRSAVISLSKVDRSTLLTRQETTALLGPPTERNENGEVVYRYRLRGNSEISAVVQVWFGVEDSRMHRLRLRYLRFEVDADFRENVAAIKFRL